MTDEELMAVAKEIVSELVRYCDITPDEHAFVLERLRPVVTRARDEGLEAACKALCEGCRAEAPFEQPAWPRYSHIFPTAASRFECGALVVRKARVSENR